MVTIALVQFYARTLKEGLPYFREAAAKAQIVIAPEAWAPRNEENDIEPGCEFLELLRDIANENHSVILTGGLVEREGRKRFIGCFAVCDKGICAKYRKMHLFESEVKRYSKGNKLSMFRIGNIRAGIAICYDIDFPEVPRAYALSGCDMLLVPSSIRDEGVMPWEIYVQARVLENRMPVAYANVSGREHFSGYSAVVTMKDAPVNGILYPELIRTDRKTGVYIFNIEPELFRKEREKRLEMRNKDIGV